MPATPSDLFAFLDRLGIAHVTVTHPALFTVEQSRELRGTIPGAHTKNLFLKDKKDALFLVVAREDAAIDLGRLHGRIGASGRLSFGRPELLAQTLGVTPGSVTPFGLINDAQRRVTVILDEELLDGEWLNFHPLHNAASTTLRSADLVRFIRALGYQPRIVRLPAPPADD